MYIHHSAAAAAAVVVFHRFIYIPFNTQISMRMNKSSSDHSRKRMKHGKKT